MPPRTLYDKLWDSHVVHQRDHGGTHLLSPQMAAAARRRPPDASST